MTSRLILSPPTLFGCQFPYPFGSTIKRFRYKKVKWCHHQQQLQTFIDNETTKDEELDFGVEDMKQLLVWVIWLPKKIFEPTIPWSTSHPWLSNTFDAYSVMLIHPSSSIQLFSKIKLLIIASLNLKTRFLLRGVVCHIPKFPFRNVNRFPKEIQNFLKDFIYFHLKWFYLNLSYI
jgi:hypothetical protein